jgi:hypothetical protein
MVQGLILVEGQNVSVETLRSTSLENALHLVIGRAPEFGVILHIAANTPIDLNNALNKFTQVSGVTGILTLGIRNPY